MLTLSIRKSHNQHEANTNSFTIFANISDKYSQLLQALTGPFGTAAVKQN